MTRTADNCVLEGAVPSRWIDLLHTILRQNSGIESNFELCPLNVNELLSGIW